MQIVELDGLAGGQMDAVDVMLCDGIRNKFQLVLCQTAASHTKPDHAGVSAPLGIASISAGEPFVGAFIQLSRIKSIGLLAEFRQIFFPYLCRNFFHFFYVLSS